MALTQLKTIPQFTDNEISEFVEYKENQKQFITKVAEFEKVLNKFSKQTGQDKNLPSLMYSFLYSVSCCSLC